MAVASTYRLNAREKAFMHAPVGIAVVDLDGWPQEVNVALCKMVGRTVQQIRDRPFRDLSYSPDIDLDAAQIAALLNGTISSYSIEKRFVHAGGRSIWVLLSVSFVRDEQDRPPYFIELVQDISERKKVEGRLAHLVDHDFLTALFNRRRFEQLLVQQIKSVARYGGRGALLLIDLDRFKAVNDRFGHKAGDDLLKAVATALSSQTRETDVLARLGGDEFGVILPHVDQSHAELVANGLLKALRRQTPLLAEHRIPMTASIGVAMFEGLGAVEMLAAADSAMYEAKAGGGDRFALYCTSKGPSPNVSPAAAKARRRVPFLTSASDSA
jgi:diguanylate cyclase (GGDEF)-like protein/PAS domain S-box-containing protein